MAIIPLGLCTIPLMRKRVDNQARFSGRKIFRRRIARARLGEQCVEWIAPHRRFLLCGLFDRRLGGIRGGRFRCALVSCRRLGFGRSFGLGLRLGGSLRRSLGSCRPGRFRRRRRRGLRSTWRLGSVRSLIRQLVAHRIGLDVRMFLRQSTRRKDRRKGQGQQGSR